MTSSSAAPKRSFIGILVAITAASVGVIYGYDQSNIAGALMFIPKEFGLTTQGTEFLATIVVIGEIVGAMGGGFLANAIGRKASMILVAATYAIFAIVTAIAPTLPILLLGRFLLGVTVGVSVVVVPVFVAESAPSHSRGRLLVAYQVATVIGLISGYVVAFFLAPSGSWRWMLGLAAVPSVLALLLLFRMPDTARWYMMRGREADARRTIALVEPDRDVDEEIADIRVALSDEAGGGIREMLRRPYLRATIFVVGLGFFIQATGINAIVFYSPHLFESMGLTDNFGKLMLPAFVQLASLAAVFVSLLLVDRMGRRPLLLGGIGMMIAANAILVGVFLAGDSFGGVLTLFGFLGVVLFTVGFTFGFGAVVWVYAGESFPARLRALGSSVMLTTNLLTNALVTSTFLSMLEGVGGAGTFVTYGLVAIASFVFVLRFAPETKGRDLEEITHVWENGGSWPDANDEPRRRARRE